MKAKLGKLDAVKDNKYSSYQALLKKTILEVIKDSQTNGSQPYVLVSGQHLNWKGSLISEEQPLFYLGQKNTWEKDLKGSKDIDLKGYSYGTCKLEKIGTDIQVSLCPEKGKLTQDTLLKPLKKVFKSFKPKIYMEVVADLNTIDMGQKNSNLDAPTTEKDLVQNIGLDLQKYHLAIEKIKQKIAQATSEEEKRPLLIKQNQILKRLKHLCAAWTTEIAPQASQLIQDKQTETWQKIYQKWQTFFEKRQAAKVGKNNDSSALKSEEERIYAKVLSDLEQFHDNLEKGNLVDPSVVETNIQNLEDHLNTWKSFTKDKTSAFSKELNLFEEKVNAIKKDWKKERDNYIIFSETRKMIQEKIDAGDFVEAQRLLNQLPSS